MRVAIYAGEIPATTFIERLVSGLANDGHQMFVFGSITKKGARSKDVTYVGIKNKLGKLGILLYALRYAFAMHLIRPKEVKKLKRLVPRCSFRERVIYYSILWYRPEVFHLQWVKSVDKYTWVKAFGIKLVVSLRGAHINYSPLADEKLAATYRTVLPQVDGFHGVSLAICKEASLYGAEMKKCQVAYSGFNPKDFPKSDWQNNFNSLKSRPIHIISVGRSHWKKGYHFALDAMAKLKSDGLKFDYTIIGAKGNEELIFLRNQLDLEVEVSFLSNVPFLEVKNKIRSSDVLLLPSVEEGIANVVLEAMFLGTLVVSADCGGMVETVEDEKSGFIVPVRNPKAIAEALETIKTMDEKVLTAMLNEAYAKVSVQHSTAEMVTRMRALYKSVLE